MLSKPSLLVVALMAVVLSGCGKNLGAYRVDAVEAVDRNDPRLDRVFSSSDMPYPVLLEVRFSGDRNLVGVPNLYIHADECPFKDRYRIGAMGPFWRYAPLNSGRVTKQTGNMTFVENVPAPVRAEPGSNRYVYSGFLIPNGAGDSGENGLPRSAAYDVFKDHRDLCLRLDSAGLYLVPSRSNEFRIGYQAIAAAMSKAPR